MGLSWSINVPPLRVVVVVDVPAVDVARALEQVLGELDIDERTERHRQSIHGS